jgi:hypothetical protein
MLNGLDGIDLSAADAKEQINALAKGLLDKNTDLLGKVNSGKEKLTGHESELERLRILEQGLEKTKLEEKENYNGALELVKQDNQKTIDKMTLGTEGDKNLIRKLLVENGLTAELVTLNVNPDLMALIQQGLSSLATVIDGKAMIGEQSLSDYMKEWATTPQGKASILAKANNGGDANGGGSEVKQGEKFSDFTGAELVTIKNQDPQRYTKLLETR